MAALTQLRRIRTPSLDRRPKYTYHWLRGRSLRYPAGICFVLGDKVFRSAKEERSADLFARVVSDSVGIAS